MITVASFGGGTDSTAMLIGMWQRKEPVDLILFADTGGEKPHTYKYISIFSEWLIAHNMPEITIVKAPKVTLEQDVLKRKSLPSIAFGFKTCSQRFKAEPCNKYIRNWIPAKEAWLRGEKITMLIGYEYGEERRAKNYDDKKKNVRYPLIELKWDRKKCIEVIKNSKLPLPGKSACFFCPSSKAQEIKQLSKQYPELAARAIAMEKNAILTDVKGLGRNYAWSDLIEFNDKQVKMFDDDWSTAEVPCGCYDG